MVALLTDDAWAIMPPEPWEYQGPTAIGAFLRDREVRRGAPLRLVPTRANTQPAFGCYLPIPNTDIARPYALFVLALEGDRISAITWFGDSCMRASASTSTSMRTRTADAQSDGLHLDMQRLPALRTAADAAEAKAGDALADEPRESRDANGFQCQDDRQSRANAGRAGRHVRRPRSRVMSRTTGSSPSRPDDR
jgi:hypothetical protein